MLEDICKSAEQSGLRYQHIQEAGILKVFGQGTTPLDLARHGLTDIEELAHTAAEHHPYWRMLNYVAEASRIILEKWDGTITQDDMEYLRWAVTSLQDSLGKESSE